MARTWYAESELRRVGWLDRGAALAEMDRMVLEGAKGVTFAEEYGNGTHGVRKPISNLKNQNDQST